MKRFLKGCTALALSLALLIPTLPVGLAVELIQSPVIVALAYGTSAVDGATIQNSIGSGFELGYLDDERNFIQLGYTDQTKISAVKTQNVYYAKLSGASFSTYNDITTDVDTSTAITVGCYHIQLPGEYTTYEEAQEVASTVTDGFVAWINGVYYVRMGSYLDSATATTALENLGVEDAALAGTSSYGISVVITGTDDIIFQFDPQGEVGLTCMPLVQDGEKAETWYWGYRYYGGFRFQRVSGGDIVVCSIVEEEDYISCVLSQEMSDSWPLEALKAQAVAVRTYCATNYGRHDSIYADICGTTHCQVYVGCTNAGANTLQAAQETEGIYAWYDGELVETYYYSCNGGATESPDNVWYDVIPYLVGKEDPYEPLVADLTGMYDWSVTYTAAELTAMLNADGYSNSTIVDVYISARTDSGNVYTVTLEDSNGKKYSFAKESARTYLGLYSANYTVVGGSGESDNSSSGSFYTTDGSVISSDSAYVIGSDGTISKIPTSAYVITSDGVFALTTQDSTSTSTSTSTTGDSYTFTGSGWGHSVGMSQWGAYSMAELGYDYVDILTFYYTGIEVY